MSPSYFDLEKGPSREEFDILMNMLKESALDMSALAEEVRYAVIECVINAFGFGIIEGIHKQGTKRSRRRKETSKGKNEK